MKNKIVIIIGFIFFILGNILGQKVYAGKYTQLLRTSSGKGTAFKVKYKNKVYYITSGHNCAAITIIENNFLLPIKIDKKNDICILKSNNSNNILQLTNSLPYKHQPLDVYGFPMYFTKEVKSSGYYIGNNAHEAVDQHFSQYEFSSNIVFPGFSGSPVLNKKKQVVGMLNLLDVSTNYSLFIPSKYIIKLLKEIHDNGR